MKKSVFSLIFFLPLFLFLLSGCRTGRQNYSNHEMVTSSQSSCSDSLLLHRIEQLRQNRTVQLEHIVYSLPDSLHAESTIQSITRVTAVEQTEEHAVTSLDAGTVEEKVTYTEEMTKQSCSSSTSSIGWWGIGVLFIISLILFKLRTIRS